MDVTNDEDVADLLRVRRAFAQSPELTRRVAGVAEQFMTTKNTLTLLAPGTQLCTRFPPSDSAVYELQTMKNSSIHPTLGEKGTLVGRFTSLYGPLNTEMAGMLESRLMVPMSASDLK